MGRGLEIVRWDGTGFPDLLMGRDRVGMGFPGLAPSPKVEMQRLYSRWHILANPRTVVFG
jgi:hypothetical protein